MLPPTSYTRAHGHSFVHTMTSPVVTAHIHALERDLPAAGVDLAGNPYSVASLVVPVHMHQTLVADPSLLRWDEFREDLDLEQLCGMVLALDDVELALLDIDHHVDDELRRSAMFDLRREMSVIAVRAVQIALCLGWDPNRSPVDLRVLAPQPVANPTP